MSTDCLFCKIIAGDIPAHKVYEDDFCFAFLDIFPLRPGHTLLIPKNHEPNFWEVEPEVYTHCMNKVKTLTMHIMNILSPKRVGMIISGFDVPHTHIHLVPLNSEKELTSESLKALNLPYPTKEELTAMAELLQC